MIENEIIENDYKIVTFKTTPKISTYLYAVAVGEYVGKNHTIKYELDNVKYQVPMTLYSRQSMSEYIN